MDQPNIPIDSIQIIQPVLQFLTSQYPFARAGPNVLAGFMLMKLAFTIFSTLLQSAVLQKGCWLQ